MTINIVSLKAPFHAERISRVSDDMAFYSIDRMFKHIGGKKNIFKKDYLIILGFYLKYKNTKQIGRILDLYRKLISSHRRTIIIFAGSDVLHFMSRPESNIILKFIRKRKVKLFSVGECLQKEIKDNLRLNVGVLKMPFNHNFDNPKVLPKEFSIGCYMPTTRGDFYGYGKIIKVIKKNKDIMFHFYANDGFVKNSYEKTLKNLVCHESPIVDMNEFIQNISCGLRITEHDGNPMTLAEYCANGRYFVYNRPMPYCTLVDPTVFDISKKINKIKNNYSRDVNLDMVNLYRNMHNKENFIENINQIFQGPRARETLREARERRKAERRLEGNILAGPTAERGDDA